jgi:hypothetical protein
VNQEHTIQHAVFTCWPTVVLPRNEPCHCLQWKYTRASSWAMPGVSPMERAARSFIIDWYWRKTAKRQTRPLFREGRP